MNSILQETKMCLICGTTKNLHNHHVYGGVAHRKISDKYGLTIYLCMDHHTGNNGIHRDYNLDLEIKKKCQLQAMAYYKWTIEDWFKLFRRSWI